MSSWNLRQEIEPLIETTQEMSLRHKANTIEFSFFNDLAGFLICLADYLSEDGFNERMKELQRKRDELQKRPSSPKLKSAKTKGSNQRGAKT